mgnify:CR=1 FL=1
MVARFKAIADKFIERFISRKFLAWGAATALVYNNMLTSEDWVAVTVVYIGAQALVDAAILWKHGPK